MISSASDVVDKDYRHHARRPAITPLFACGCALWAATAIAYAQARLIDIPTLQKAFFAFVALAILLLGASCALKRFRSLSLLLASMAMGACLAFAQATNLHTTGNTIEDLDTSRVLLEIKGDSDKEMFGEAVDATLVLPSGRSLFVRARFDSESALYFGQRYEASGKLQRIDYRSRDYDWQQGYAAVFKVNEMQALPSTGATGHLARFRMKAIEAIGSQDDAHAVVQALSCGFRRSIKGSEAYSCYQSCGLAHLIAVSGAHLVIVTSLMAALLKLAHVPRAASIGILACCMVSYVILAAAPISALRALLMSSVGILALFGKRAPSSQNALGLSIFIILIHAPAEAVSASFALSALSTAGIVLFSPLVSSWLEQVPILGKKTVRDALSLTMAASLLSQPLSCALFGMLPLASPLANIVTSPLFAPLCGISLAAALACGFGLPFAGALSSLASFAANFVNGVVALISTLPFASIPFTCDVVGGTAASALAAVLLWACWPRRRGGLCALAGTTLLVACVLLVDLPGDRIVMLDVGQGDAILLKSRGSTLLIDTGNNDSQLLSELASQHVATLDALVITHADDDHCGSIDALRRAVQVNSGMVPADMLACDEVKVARAATDLGTAAKNIVPIEAGDSFSIGAFKLTAIWPHSYEDEGGNADSLCLWMEYDGDDDGLADFTALFTGDAEAQQLEAMLAERPIKDIDLLKVGHHGSKNALSQEEAERLSPSIALIGVGTGNRYGHPSERTLECLEKAGASIYRTDLNGTITCKLDSKALAVSCTR